MTFCTTRLVMFCAELATVEVVIVRLSRVAVPTGSLAEVPLTDQIPAQVRPPSSRPG